MLADILDGECFILVMAGYKLLDQIDGGRVLAPVLNLGEKLLRLLCQQFLQLIDGFTFGNISPEAVPGFLRGREDKV